MIKYIPKNNAGPYNSITTAALMPSKEYMSYQDMLQQQHNRQHKSFAGFENIVNHGLSPENDKKELCNE